MNNQKPPRLAALLVRLRFGRMAAECLLGDLEEEFHSRARSNAWYWRQVLSTLRFLPAQVRKEEKKRKPMRLLSGFWNDVRYALRSLGKSPGLTVIAMLAIALGVGVNTTIGMPGRLATALAGVLGGFALLLASIGIYGVVSYAVSRRVREIGIRMTLGADHREVLRLVLQGAMAPVAIGAGFGVAACAGVSRVLSTVLYGISPLDPVAFGGVTLFLLAIALLASYLPARRATRVDPMVALRY